MTIEEANKSLRKGVRIVSTKTINGTSAEKGSTGTVDRKQGSMWIVNFDDGNQWTCYPSELALLKETKETLAKYLKILEKQVEKIESKIKFMEANGIDEFDEQAFKVYQILQEVHKGTNDYSTALKISKIVG